MAQAAMPLSANETCSWHLSALFCLESHHTSDHIDYIRGWMSSCLAHMQKTTRCLLSLQLLSFITPRHALDRRNVPVFVILHCYCTVGLSTVEALLTSLTFHEKDSIEFAVTSCTPLDIGPEIRCPDFTLILHLQAGRYLCARQKEEGFPSGGGAKTLQP